MISPPAAFMPLLNAINQAGGGAPLTPEISANNSQIIKVYADNQPVQAYITEQQVTATQARVMNIKKKSKLF